MNISYPAHWFRTATRGVPPRFQMVGLFGDGDGPGLVLGYAPDFIDYAPDAGELGQMQLFALVPETLISVSVEVVPSLDYCRARQDWTEQPEWTPPTNVSDVVMALSAPNTLTEDAHTVE